MVCGRLLNSWIVINHLVAIVFSNKVHMGEEKHIIASNLSSDLHFSFTSYLNYANRPQSRFRLVQVTDLVGAVQLSAAALSLQYDFNKYKASSLSVYDLCSCL